MKHHLIFIIIVLIISSCSNEKSGDTVTTPVASAAEPSWDTQDLTEAGVFTSGIEGPAVAQDGNLYVVNYETEGTIGEVLSDGISSMFVNLPDTSIGNGIRFLRDGNMVIADYKRHNVLMVDMSDRSIQIMAHEPTMNQPNDLAVTSTDILFASDPNWKESTGNIWRIDPSGEVTLLEANMGTTNGIEVSPDETKLYVNESVQRNVWVYDLSSSGEVSNKQLLIKFEDYGMDGMRCDMEGNLFITRHGKGTVAVVSPEGKLIKEYVTQGKKPSNIAFGGPDGRTCYVTLQDRGAVETFRAEVPGRAWKMMQ